MGTITLPLTRPEAMILAFEASAAAFWSGVTKMAGA